MITFLLALASLTTGAYIGSVVDDKLDTPVQINTQTATVSNSDSGIFNLSKSDLIKYGLLGLLAFYIYRKYLRK